MLRKEYPQLAAQWNKELNNEIGLDFNTITPGSIKLAW